MYLLHHSAGGEISAAAMSREAGGGRRRDKEATTDKAPTLTQDEQNHAWYRSVQECKDRLRFHVDTKMFLTFSDIFLPKAGAPRFNGWEFFFTYLYLNAVHSPSRFCLEQRNSVFWGKILGDHARSFFAVPHTSSRTASMLWARTTSQLGQTDHLQIILNPMM